MKELPIYLHEEQNNRQKMQPKSCGIRTDYESLNKLCD
jgi:hypothetical protein